MPTSLSDFILSARAYAARGPAAVIGTAACDTDSNTSAPADSSRASPRTPHRPSKAAGPALPPQQRSAPAKRLPSASQRGLVSEEKRTLRGTRGGVACVGVVCVAALLPKRLASECAMQFRDLNRTPFLARSTSHGKATSGRQAHVRHPPLGARLGPTHRLRTPLPAGPFPSSAVLDPRCLRTRLSEH